MSKLWSTGKKINQKVYEFTVGSDFVVDDMLLPYDVEGSIAHAKMLEKQGILSKKELSDILKSLKNLLKEYDSGKVEVSLEDEDMHTVIENYLIKSIGDAGKKIHTGRSRNDQVLTALRLYYKDAILEMIEAEENFIKALQGFKKKHGKVEMAGYTHMRKAMPTTIDTWAGAYVESGVDNVKMLSAVLELIDQSPLGSGAGYGVPMDTMKKFTSSELGFANVQDNPIYVQNSRGKFEAMILSSLVFAMSDLNKMASDLIMFSMPEFGIFKIPEEFTTGSSIMPQKKNPDVLELVRAKYHVIAGEEFKIKGIMSNLMFGYHRDSQLVKEAVVNGIETSLECIEIMGLVVSELSVDKKKAKDSLTDELYATEKVYDLVKKGKSFRDAYKEVKKKL